MIRAPLLRDLYYDFRERVKRMLFIDPVDLVEFGVGFALALRGAWMLYWDNTIPLDVQGLLIPLGVREWQWGLILVCLGLTQVYVSGDLRQKILRGTIATFAGLVQGMAGVAYFLADQAYRGAVPFIASVVLAEMFIAFRSWVGILAKRRVSDGLR